jgi:hypothetical protein
VPSSDSVLLITNRADSGRCPGTIDAIQRLVDTGELSALEVIHAGPDSGELQKDRDARVVEEIRRSRQDIVLVLSLKDSITAMDGVAQALAGRPLVYWEGDPWGRGKRISDAMTSWMQLSSVVFSVGGEPQSTILRSHGARDVRLVVHTYDHIVFQSCEKRFDWSSAEGGIGFIGSNVMRAPIISGLPGSWQRFQLVRRLRASSGHFLLAGPGWPPGWSYGAIDFTTQTDFVQECSVIANWDHYPRTRDYTSDRLAITMVAGRPQVTTKHPGMAWAPDDTHGVFLTNDVDSTVATALALAERTPDELRSLGQAAHRWVRGRLDHRSAYRYMLSCMTEGVEPPQGHPWDSLPAA